MSDVGALVTVDAVQGVPRLPVQSATVFRNSLTEFVTDVALVPSDEATVVTTLESDGPFDRALVPPVLLQTVDAFARVLNIR